MRNLVDDYLDGAMATADRAAFERQLAADPSLARLLSNMKQERALRAAAYASFEPTREEAQAAADRMMDAVAGQRPAGYVGNWWKRTLGVAAGLAIVAGSFAFGRMTSETVTVEKPVVKLETHVVYRVMYFGEEGEKEVREFATHDEAIDFVNRLDTRRSEAQVAAVADLSSPGSF
jgi:anti-sigma factor RsiW